MFVVEIMIIHVYSIKKEIIDINFPINIKLI